MQNVGAAWLMSSLTPSPTLVALVQTATSLPFLVAALPAGALADIVDRRKLLMAAQGWMFSVALVLAVLTWIGAMTPALLLVLTFALGLGLAVNLPTWQSIQPDLVPRSELPQAIAFGGVNINLSRAIGPAIGGFVIAATFLINAVSFLFALFVFSRWQGSPLDAGLTERLPGPVLVTVEYRVAPEHSGTFLREMKRFGRIRRRDGAYRWECSATPPILRATWRPSWWGRGPNT